MLTPTGHTRLAAVIGSPVRHSLSPAIHNAGFRVLGLDWVYLAFEVPEGSAAGALEAVRTLGIEGLSVTMPHKAAVAAVVDERTAAAETLGAVNCVVNRGGRLIGDNTDGGGFLDGLADDSGIAIPGARCGVIGAGGAARAVVLALAEAGAAEVLVVNRSQVNAERAASIAGARGRVASAEELATCGLVVNATPLGMGSSGTMPLPPDLLTVGQVAVDLVYEPAETPWLRALRERGIEAHNGLSMLVHQAARAFVQWTGSPAPVAEMRRATADALSSR